MKVYANCSHCKKKNGFFTMANTRLEYAMKNGDFKEFSCKKCD